MNKPQFLIIPEGQARDDVSALLALPRAKLLAVAEELAPLKDLRSEEQPFRRLARRADLAQSDALAVYFAISNLAEQKHAYELSEEQVKADLAAAFPAEVAALGDGIAPLLAVLGALKGQGVEGKAESLRTAVIPHFVGLKSVCEIRPVFNDERDKAAAAILITLLALRVHDADHDTKTHVFQVTSAQLAKIKECVEEAERKLGVLREQFGSVVELF